MKNSSVVPLHVDQETIDRLLAGVEKPVRYIGGELHSIVKEKDKKADNDGGVSCRIALCFPDTYEVAESHIGLKILYDVLNGVEHFAAERVYAFWPDLEKNVRAEGVALWSLESHRVLSAFDMIGFTLQYELCYPTILAMLDLGGVPLRASERQQDDAFVIGGGVGSLNPEPIAPFFDAFLLGDGEHATSEIAQAIADGRQRNAPRSEILVALASIVGVYVPSFYEPHYDGIAITRIDVRDDVPQAKERSRHGTPRVVRRVLADLDTAPYPTRTIVPNMRPVHSRVAIEIQRGCSQACRFCQAGMVTRPTRQRKPETILKLADDALRQTGNSELGLLSLSAGDYAPINTLLKGFFERYNDGNVSVSLPSMRTETMTPELAEQVATVKKSGFTLAPEAGSERLRRVINKTNSEENLLNAVRATVTAGWRRLKFYFMIGLPTETDEDIQAIVDLAQRARAEGRKIRPDIDVTVSVSTFCPKPHTPFQWEAQINAEQTQAKQQWLNEQLKRLKIAFRYHSPQQSFLEGILSRGDRRLADGIEAAMRAGCRLDAWTEHFDLRAWQAALEPSLEAHGLAPQDYLAERDEKALLPWDHLDAGILKKFLRRDRKRAYAESTIDDCAFSEHCYACGGCELGDPYAAKRAAQDSVQPLEGGPEAGDKLRPLVLGAPPRQREVVAVRHQEKQERRTPPAMHDQPDPSTLPARTRLRFRFTKLGRAFHMSHLDVKEHVLRAVRLSDMPVIYSRGFTRRPKVGFSPACPTGIASEAEYFETDCIGFPDPQRYAKLLSSLLPDGLFVVEADACEIPRSAPSLNEALSASTYVVTRPPSMQADDFMQRIESFAVAPSILVRVMRKKRGRVMDARAQIGEVSGTAERLRLTIAFGETGTIKIGEAVAAILGDEYLDEMKIRKVEVSFDSRTAQQPRHKVDGEGPNVLDLRHVSQRQQPGKSTERKHESKRHSSQPRTVPYAE